MKIERVELRELAVNLKFRFETSFGVERDLHKVLLVVHSGGLEGYGEVTANREPGYSYETAAVAWMALEEYVLPRVVGKEFHTPAQLIAALKAIRGHNMAVAALEILGLTDRIAERLDVEAFVPAIGQGCVAVECRVDDETTQDALSAIDHAATRYEVEVERAFLSELGGSCSLPVGGHVRAGRLWTFLADLDTGDSVENVVELSGGPDDLEIARSAARAARGALG